MEARICDSFHALLIIVMIFIGNCIAKGAFQNVTGIRFDTNYYVIADDISSN